MQRRLTVAAFHMIEYKKGGICTCNFNAWRTVWAAAGTHISTRIARWTRSAVQFSIVIHTKPLVANRILHALDLDLGIVAGVAPGRVLHVQGSEDCSPKQS